MTILLFCLLSFGSLYGQTVSGATGTRANVDFDGTTTRIVIKHP